MTVKQNRAIRIGSQNVNQLNIMRKEGSKMHQLIKMIKTRAIDIVGLQEAGIRMSKAPHKEQWAESLLTSFIIPE